MTRTEKLVTAAVFVVNLAVALVLVEEDSSELAQAMPLAPDAVAAVSPMPAGVTVTVSETKVVAKR